MTQSANDNIIFFIALLATALALGAAMAHVLAFPNKIGLSQEEYFVAQKAYRGWSKIGILLAVELTAMIAIAVTRHDEPKVLWPVLAAIASLLAAQAVFWIFTYPANVATDNWTKAPNDWHGWKETWEYSHLAVALFQVMAMSALIIAALRRSPLP